MGQNNGYTEEDITEMARALTGWVCSNETCEPSSFVPERFDNTDKRFLGKPAIGAIPIVGYAY